MSTINLQQDRDSFLKDLERERDRFRGALAIAAAEPGNKALFDAITQRLVEYAYASRAHMEDRSAACRENLLLLAALAWRTARALGVEHELPFTAEPKHG